MESCPLMKENDLIELLAKDGMIPVSGLLTLMMPSGEGLGFGVKGLDGRYQLGNRAMTQLLRPGAESLTGKLESDLVPAPLLKALAHSDESIINGAAAASLEVALTDNGHTSQYRWLKLPVLGADGKQLWAIASMIHHLSVAPRSATIQQALDRLQQAHFDLQQTVLELEQMASTDRLTGAWNRRRLEECVHNEMDRLERYQQPLSLLLIDIDYFKRINDQHGHAAGDQVLQALSSLLQLRLRGTDSLARWGGEEFIVLCPNSRRSAAAALAERLRRQVAAATFPVVGRLTVSIGAAECKRGESWQEWFERADQALYRAKESGRNQVQLAPDPTVPESSAEYVVANFVQLVWRPAFESGDERIDHGHRQLFTDANELLGAILSEQAIDRVGAIVDRLIADVLEHFRDEEAVVAAAGFPGLAEHKLLHAELANKALQLVEDYRVGKQGVGEVFQFLTYDVVTKHMLGADRQFFAYLRPADVQNTGSGSKRRQGQRPA
mgnify:CR=1 FL=1